MRIAVPVANGQLCAHFGHSEKFFLFDVDPQTRKILGVEELVPPEHQPGVLPPWLAEKGVEVVIAGGMGERAKSLFAEWKIEVVVGAFQDTPEHLVARYLENALEVGENRCDH